jgi:hypothetical protein
VLTEGSGAVALRDGGVDGVPCGEQCNLILRYMTHKIHSRYMSDTKGYIRGYVSRCILMYLDEESRIHEPDVS